jgi:hypothetical protein
MIVGVSKEDLERYESQIRSKFRFAIEAEGGRCSRPWCIWSRKDDVYIASSGIGGQLKLSLHSKGYCQLAMTSEYYRSLPPIIKSKLPGRVIEKWQRPATPEHGAIHVLSLLFPTNFLTGPQLKGSHGKPLTLFPAAPSGHALELGVFYSQEEPQQLGERFGLIGIPFLWVALTGGEHVSIVLRSRVFDGAPLGGERHVGSDIRPLGETLGQMTKGQKLSDLTALVALHSTSEARIFAEVSGVSLTKN